MLVLRWWPYETEGFLSTSRLCFGLDCEAGVTPRGEAFRVPAALRARPRVRDGSREAGGGNGAVFGAMRRGSGGGLVPVRSGGGMDGEVAWPRPSEDSSRGAMGRTWQRVSGRPDNSRNRGVRRLWDFPWARISLIACGSLLDIPIVVSQRRSQARAW